MREAEQQLHGRLRSDGDQRAVVGRRFPADPIAGTPARTVTGGLMYAGVNGNKTTQGNPPKVKWSPRVGAVYSLNAEDRAARRLRALLGAVELPGAEHADAATTARSASRSNTRRPADRRRRRPSSLTNPFPNGARAAARATALGALTGVGTTSASSIRTARRRACSSTRSTCSASCRARMAITVSYIGARGDHLPLGGIGRHRGQHQPARSEVPGARRGALSAAAAEPVLRQPERAGAAVDAGDADARAAAAAVSRSSCNINARQVPEGVNRYNAGVVEWTKRLTQRLGRPRQLHLQRAEGQPGRRDQLLLARRHRRCR